MTETQKVRQLILEYLATQGSIPSGEYKLKTEVRLAGFDASQVEAELETLEMMGCVHRLPSLTGARWIILEKGKEALNA
nr:MAG TPA: Z DNA-binding protein [Caudoviricetes sp.]